MAPPSARSPWAVLASTSLAVFAVFLDTTILFVAFPSIQRRLLRREPVDPVVGAQRLHDRVRRAAHPRRATGRPDREAPDVPGRRRCCSRSPRCCAALAPTAGLLVAARILQAVGAAALVPSSLALVLQTFPRSKIPVAVAIWGAVGAVAGAAGPTLGALVVENFGWRWAFFINLPVGIVSFFLGRRVLPEGREANPGRLPDPLGVVLLAGGLALAAYGIVMTDDWGWASTSFVGTMLSRRGAGRAVRAALPLVPNPLLDLACSSRRRSAGPTPARSPSRSGSTRCSSATCCSSPRSGATRSCDAGLAISVGPLIVGGDRAVLRPAGRAHRPATAAHARRAGLGRRRDAADPAGVHHRRLRGRVPAGRGAHRPGRVALPAAAVVGRGPGPAARPLRLGLGGEPGHPQPRRHARRRRWSVAFTSDLTPATALDDFQHVWWLLVVSGISVTPPWPRGCRAQPRHRRPRNPQPVGAMA